MNLARTLVLLAAAVLAAGVFAPSAQAQYGVGGYGVGGYGGGGYGWGGGWPYTLQTGIYNTYTMPYFTLHPPVYYSHVVPRPYGISPFAAPPGVIPAEMLVAPAPQMIENPHFLPEEKKPADEPGKTEKTSGRTTTARLEIVNPFYQPGPTRVARLPSE